MVVRLSENPPSKRKRGVWKAIVFILGLTRVIEMTNISTDIMTNIYPSASISISAPQDAPLTAILVEVRCTRTLPLVLKQAVNHLRDYDQFLIIHSAKNQQYIEEFIRSDPDLLKLLEGQQLKMRQVNETDLGDTQVRNQYLRDFWYSRMMTDSNFWKGIATPYAITLQWDTLICRPFLADEFIDEKNVSFIGGLSSAVAPMYPNPTHSHIVGHLNGGLSLRNVAWTIQCIEQFRNASTVTGEGEDAFFRDCREANMTGTGHTSQLQAYSFSSDNGWTLCFNTTKNGERICPFGVHKPWTTKSLRSPAYIEMMQNCPGLDQLKPLASESSACS